MTRETGKSESPAKTLLPSLRTFTIYLDSLLLVLFILLLSPRMTGLPIHELMGLILFVPIVLHLLLAWPWIHQTSKRVFLNASKRTRFNYFLNAGLFVLLFIEIVSGVVISRVALPFLGIKMIEDSAWRSLHNQTLNWAKLFGGLHIAVNWKWILAALRKKLSTGARNRTAAIDPWQKFLEIIGRTALIFISAGIIALVLFGLLGLPTLSRLYQRDEIARFTPTVAHGILQFSSQSFLVGLVAYISHRWLNVRL